MIIKYYTDNDLAYANRKRRRSIESYTTDLTENQKAVKLGDGATTSIITSEANLCNYVTIGDTRWYVVANEYLNGGQIELFLKRDVIGEFGLENFVGKIERGYTESFLRNRKELDLNQILKKRIPLIASEDTYGNYEIDNHDNEMWGILYFAKPTELDPLTGSAYPDTKTINIPAFKPNVMEYTKIADNTTFDFSVGDKCFIVFDASITYMKTALVPETKMFELLVHFEYLSNYNRWHCDYVDYTEKESSSNYCEFNSSHNFNNTISALRDAFSNYANTDNSGHIIPKVDILPVENYDGAILYDAGDYIQYSITRSEYVINTNFMYLKQDVADVLSNTDGVISYNIRSAYPLYYAQNTRQGVYTYNYVVLDDDTAGNLTLNFNQQLVDEPYIIYAFPLYDVEISRDAYTDPGGTSIPAYNKEISKETAFMIFNTVIQATSGENAYLVDAQIYPYCPELVDIASIIKGYPFFNIQSTSYYRNINVQLLPYTDVKKEYIKREYCLVSPDQGGSFKFNYYDYSNSFSDNYGINEDVLTISIKTALKPMSIVSSAVITPKEGSIIGITYPSDLRGCRANGGGYEVSLSTNKFQEYVRNNSNYLSLFNLQREELQKQHNVELANDITSTIVNTTTATAMGAIGGMAMGSAGIASAWGTKALAAGIGASAAGTTVGVAMSAQTIVNEKLREYERTLQQENFDLQIGTIKNIPNQVSRISSFNEIIMRNFYYVIEVYECSDIEGEIVDKFIERYAYGLGIIGEYEDFKKNNWFLRGTLITSNLIPILHNIAREELNGGIYYIYE